MTNEYKKHIEEKFTEWLDNTDLKGLGIIKWARDLLPEYVPNATPDFHITILMMLLTLLDPELKNKYERFRNIIVFRGGAKSTLINKLFAAYLLANNGREIKVRRIKFVYDERGHITGITPTDEIFITTINEKLIVLASETGGSAENTIVDLRNEFDSNSTLKYYYKAVVQEAKESDTGQWTQRAFKINGCFIMGVGTGYQIRGKIRGASRPTFMIFDDIYSENNIGEHERPKTARWFNNAAMNSVDDVRGKACVINTIVHEDTVPVHLKDDYNWKTIEIPLMPLEKFHKFVKEHLEVDYGLGRCKLPFDDIQDDQEKRKKQHDYFTRVQSEFDWELAWGDRITLYELALKFRGEVAKHNTSGLYQEYFHKVVSDNDKQFRKEFFQYIKHYELKREFGYNWININDASDSDGNLVWNIIDIQFGLDQAGGFVGSDDAVIFIAGTMSNGKVINFPPVYGKFSDRDDVKDDDVDVTRLDKVMLDRSRVDKIGLYDECFRQYLTYYPSKIKIGVGGQERGSSNKLRKLFNANKIYAAQISERPQTVRESEKAERIKNTLLNYYQTRMVYHTSNYIELEHQLEYLGKTKNDDIADAAEVAYFDKTTPQAVPYSFFKPTKSGVPSELLNVVTLDWKVM